MKFAIGVNIHLQSSFLNASDGDGLGDRTELLHRVDDAQTQKDNDRDHQREAQQFSLHGLVCFSWVGSWRATFSPGRKPSAISRFVFPRRETFTVRSSKAEP